MRELAYQRSEMVFNFIEIYLPSALVRLDINGEMLDCGMKSHLELLSMLLHLLCVIRGQIFVGSKI